MPTDRRERPDWKAVGDLARQALTRPRSATQQVLEHLLAHHDVSSGEVALWLREELSTLESYEIDLLLSPLFTPEFRDRLEFEKVLGEASLEATEVDELASGLARENLNMTLLAEGETVEAPLPEVLIERYVRLLYLDSKLPPECTTTTGAQLSPEVRCHLRDKVWQFPRNRDLLPALLDAAREVSGELPGHVRFLTNFVRSHRPGSLEECRTFLDNLAQAYEDDLRKHLSGTRSFFNDEIRATYAGRWSVDEDVVTSHRHMVSMARALREALG